MTGPPASCRARESPSLTIQNTQARRKHTPPCFRAIGTCSHAAMTGIIATELRLTPVQHLTMAAMTFPALPFFTGPSTALPPVQPHRCAIPQVWYASLRSLNVHPRPPLPPASLQGRPRKWANHMAEIGRTCDRRASPGLSDQDSSPASLVDSLMKGRQAVDDEDCRPRQVRVRAWVFDASLVPRE